MPFPRRLLADHEELILDLRPHWVALVWPGAQTLVILAGLGAALVYTPDDWPDVLTWIELGLALVLLLAYPVRALVAYATSHFVVTSDRVISREGWFAKRSMEMPLERINDVRFRQSVLERLLGAGDLVIESAGEHGQNRFTDIRRPEAVQKTIFEAGERNAHRGPAAAHARPQRDTERFEEAEHRTTETIARAPSLDEQLERIADLRDRGVIDEAEFQEAKDRILGDAPEG